MELTINISKRKKSSFDNPIINAIIGVFLFIFLILAGIVSTLIIMPYEFLKYKVFGFKRNYEFNATPTLFENENFNLTLEYIEQPNDEHKIANDFLYKVVDYGDETAIFIVKNSGTKTELDGIYLTPFKYELNNFLFLQKIRADEKGEPTSDLIKFDTSNGTIEFIGEIGQFELEKFDEEKNEIIGYNLSEDIVIKMEKACA